jgi:cytidine deaminase
MLYAPEARVLEEALRQASMLSGDPNHTVAAAAMDTRGRIHSAVNNHHFTGGPCAELVVLGVAAASNAGPLVTMVAVGDQSRGVIPPCGRCRQVLLDQHPDCNVIVPTPEGHLLAPIRKLLPYTYNFPDASPERFVRFSARYYDDVLAGRKTATTRFDDPVIPGEAWLLFEFDDEYKRLPGLVKSVQRKRFSEIDDSDAALENARSADDLREGLRGHYPTIKDDDWIDVVKFVRRTH